MVVVTTVGILAGVVLPAQEGVEVGGGLLTDRG